MRLIDAEALKKELDEQMNFEENCRDSVFDIIDNAPTVEYPFYQEAYQTGCEEGRKDFERPQINVIPQECIKVLAEAVVDVTQQIDWTSLCEKLAERPKGKWTIVDDVYCECPFCKNREVKFSKYCPECGARLKGGAE